MSDTLQVKHPEPGLAPRRTDWLILGGLLATALFHLVTRFRPGALPFEDAAMLLRYAVHLAHGHGIVWNVGQAPVDGATDFLFLLTTAAVTRAGVPVDQAAYALAALAHLATVGLVYGVVRWVVGGSRWAGIVSASCIAFGHGPAYVQMLFGTTSFALLAAATWGFALRLALHGPERKADAIGFACSGLLLGMARPEGTLYALFMLLALVFYRGWRPCRTALLAFGAVFLLAGGAYFLWRWHYFGDPLPNAFYKKHVPLSLHGLRFAFDLATRMLLPLALVLPLGFRDARLARTTVFTMIPLALFGLVWALMSNEANQNLRFQYPLVPVAAMSWPLIVGDLGRDFGLPRLADLGIRRRLAAGAALAALSLVPVVMGSMQDYTPRYDFTRKGIADLIRPYASKGYVIATSEAGVIALYSEWKAIDTWGLNDPWIAHHGEVTESYLDRFAPAIVLYNANFSPLAPPRRAVTPWDAQWDSMVLVLHGYVQKRGYILAAAEGRTPNAAIHYWVRADLPEAPQIVEGIRARVTLNFADFTRTPR